MKKSHLRSLLKAFSWRVLGTLMTIVISYIVTHRIGFSVSIGLFDFISKIIIFYLHDRVWENIPFGKSKLKKEESSS